MIEIQWRRRDLISGSIGTWTVLHSLASTHRPEPRRHEPKIPNPPNRKLGFAVVGLGKVALERILPAFASCEHARIAALVSGDAGKARATAAHYGVATQHVYTYANFDAIGRDPDVDIVYIALPNSLHAEYTLRALRAGKHVLCEKPMATNLLECDLMIETAKSVNRKLMIAYRLHHEPFNQKAMEFARELPFGPITAFEAVNIQDVQAPNIRLKKDLGGGPLADVGIYCINAARYILQEQPVEVFAQHRYRKDDKRFTEVPSSTAFTLRFPSGVLASCICGFDGGESRRYRVHCERGWFELDPAFAYTGLRLRSLDGEQIADAKLEPVDHFAKEMDHFAECVRHDRDPRTPGEEGLADMRILNALERSAALGRIEKVTD